MYWWARRDSNSHPEGLVSKTSVATDYTTSPYSIFGQGDITYTSFVTSILLIAIWYTRGSAIIPIQHRTITTLAISYSFSLSRLEYHSCLVMSTTMFAQSSYIWLMLIFGKGGEIRTLATWFWRPVDFQYLTPSDCFARPVRFELTPYGTPVNSRAHYHSVTVEQNNLLEQIV